MDKTKKFYTMFASANYCDTYEDAEKQAKREAGNMDCGFRNGDVYILETIAIASAPVPDVEVTKL